MIVCHYNPATSELLATIHGIDRRDWAHYADVAMKMLKRISDGGVAYRIKCGNLERIGYT